MTTYVETNMEKKVSIMEMVRKDFMPVAMRKHHPLTTGNYLMMM